MPILDYEEFYRTFAMASLKFKLGYVKVLIWLPVYQFLIVCFGSLIFLRLFSVFCVAISFFLVKKNCEAAGLSDVAVATALMYILNPLVVFYGAVGLSESFATMLILMFVYLFKREKHVLASAVLSLGVLTSYALWVFLPLVLVFLGFKRCKSALVYVFPVVMLIWWGMVNWIHAGEPLNFVYLAKFYYEKLTEQLPLFANDVVKLLFFPVIYPLSFTFPFYTYIWRISKVKKFTFEWSFVIFYIVLLFIGQSFGFVFGWARYFLPVVPMILIMGGRDVLASNMKRVWVIAYLACGVIAALFQIQFIKQFRDMMLARG